MKTLKIFLGGLIFLLGVTFAATTKAQPGFRANVSFNDFYVELSPYGRWMTMPDYGQVWIYNEPGFRPYYSNGQWTETDLGYSWSSGYSWGWAPFHYGRWEHDPMYGWFWIPGYEYAPAWVVWSEANGYYGWAPLGFGLNVNIAIGHIPVNRWMYAPRARIGYARIDRYCVPQRRVNVYYQRQRPIVNVHVYNNVRYDRGPVRQHSRPPSYSQNNYRNNNNIDRSNPNYGSRPDRRISESNASPDNIMPQTNQRLQEAPRTGNRAGTLPAIASRPQSGENSNRPSNNMSQRREELRNSQQRIQQRPEQSSSTIGSRPTNRPQNNNRTESRTYNSNSPVNAPRRMEDNRNAHQRVQPRTQSTSQNSRVNRNEPSINRNQNSNMMSQERLQRTNKAESIRR